MCVTKTEAIQIEITYITYCTDWTTQYHVKRARQGAQFVSWPMILA